MSCFPTKELITNEQLQKLVEEISLSYFGKKFQHKAMFNSRLRTVGGRYHLSSHLLDFNPKVVEKYGKKELIGVIKHELCHYHLHLEGKGYQHKDQDFKQLLKRTGGSRYVKPLSDKKEQTYHLYQCQQCHQLISRKRKINIQKFICAQCKGRLLLIAKTISK